MPTWGKLYILMTSEDLLPLKGMLRKDHSAQVGKTGKNSAAVFHNGDCAFITAAFYTENKAHNYNPQFILLK